eukprot:jgi/Mesvir1/18578/Mv17087-RA.1
MPDLVNILPPPYQVPFKRKREVDRVQEKSEAMDVVKSVLLKNRQRIGASDATIDTCMSALQAYPAVLPTGGALEIHHLYKKLEEHGLPKNNLDYSLLSLELRHVAEKYHDTACMGHREWIECQCASLRRRVSAIGWKVSPAFALVCPRITRKLVEGLARMNEGFRPNHVRATGLLFSTVQSDPAPPPRPPQWSLGGIGEQIIHARLMDKYTSKLRWILTSGDNLEWARSPSVRDEYPSKAVKETRLAWSRAVKLESAMQSPPERCRRWHNHEDQCALVPLERQEFGGMYYTWDKQRPYDTCLYPVHYPYVAYFDFEVEHGLVL